jgi:hypothetical protein
MEGSLYSCHASPGHSRHTSLLFDIVTNHSSSIARSTKKKKASRRTDTEKQSKRVHTLLGRIFDTSRSPPICSILGRKEARRLRRAPLTNQLTRSQVP